MRQRDHLVIRRPVLVRIEQFLVIRDELAALGLELLDRVNASFDCNFHARLWDAARETVVGSADGRPDDIQAECTSFNCGVVRVMRLKDSTDSGAAM